MTLYTNHYLPEEGITQQEKIENVILVEMTRDPSRRKKYYWLDIRTKNNPMFSNDCCSIEMNTIYDTWWIEQ